MVKQLIAFLFLLTFGIQTFSKAFIVVDYYTNTSAFAKNCENKAVSKLRCNGRCQLMKKLKQEEKKEDQNPERKAQNKNEIALSSNSLFSTNIFPNYKLSLLMYADLVSGKGIKIPGFVFHPPSV